MNLIARNNKVVCLKAKPKKSTIPKYFIYYFIIIQTCIGINFGFVSALKKQYRRLVNSIAVTTFLISMLIYLLSLTRSMNIEIMYYMMHALQYLLLVSTTHFTKYKIYNFLTDIHKIEMPIQNRTYKSILISTTVYTFLALTIKVFLFIIISMRSDRNNYCSFLPDIVMLLPICSIDLLQIVFVTISSHALVTLTQLQRLYEKSEISVREFIKLFISLADTYDNIRPFMERSTLNVLFFDFLKILFEVWAVLRYLTSDKNWSYYAIELSFAMFLLIQLILPCIMSELINSRTSSIMDLFSAQLAKEQDYQKTVDLGSVLTYMTARRLNQEIWNVVPTDIQLIAILIGVCTAYAIVMIQFTHVVD